jgi:hypothetical protein
VKDFRQLRWVKDGCIDLLTFTRIWTKRTKDRKNKSTVVKLCSFISFWRIGIGPP